MSEEPTDIETLQKSRTERLEAWLAELTSHLTHHGWQTTDAEVLECRRVRMPRSYANPVLASGPQPILRGYVVTFSYAVDGRTYNGVLNSPVEVEPHDTFDLRYNPAQPDENNSLGSEGGLASTYAFMGAALVILMLVFFFVHLLTSTTPGQ
jgi:hypothetical protein